MADGASFAIKTPIDGPVDLDTAIKLIETLQADSDIRVDLGDGMIARADGAQGLQGLLQRLRGHRVIMAIAAGATSAGVQPMRSGKPDMHPDVAIILDALKT
jgi:hypothetical protein